MASSVSKACLFIPAPVEYCKKLTVLQKVKVTFQIQKNRENGKSIALKAGSHFVRGTMHANIIYLHNS